MFLELNHVKDFTKRDLIICDEAHNLESILMNQLKLKFSKKDLKEYVDFDLNDHMIENLNNGNFNYWIRFVENIKKSCQEKLEKIEYLNKPELFKKILFLRNEINSCNHFIQNLNYENGIWIFDYDEELENIEFKPLKINNYAQKMLFDFSDVCIFMSATILDYELFSKWFGIPLDKVYAIRKKSPFNIKQNPVIASNKYNLSKSSIKVNASKTINLIKKILDNHKSEKGIIHTVSKQCMYFLKDNIKDDRLITHDNKNMLRQLERFKESEIPLVLLSPSMDEGVDLPDDFCRFQIIYKIPYPDLGDKQIKLRSELDSRWYDYKTSLRLVQTHGRGMRHENDYCKTYFIDNRLKDYVIKNQFLPDTFKNSIQFEQSTEKQKLIKKAEKFIKNKDYEKAIRIYKNMIDEDFYGDYYPYLMLAILYHEIDLYEMEVEIILQFLKLNINVNEEIINKFKEKLKKLDEMGYFDYDLNFS